VLAQPTGEIQRPGVGRVIDGYTEAVLNDVIVIPFNEPDVAAQILDAHRDSIAGILIDLIPHRVGLSRRMRRSSSAWMHGRRQTGRFTTR